MGKGTVCRYYQLGNCNRGDNCTFEHRRSHTDRDRDWGVPSSSTAAAAAAENSLKKLPCRFFAAGKCKYGNRCRFSHSIVEKGERPICAYFLEGNCMFGDKCVDIHPQNNANKGKSEGSKVKGKGEKASDLTCGICMELVHKTKAKSYGLLKECDHVFCLDCIRYWRQKKDSGMDVENAVLACPVCRKHSDYVVPSRFYCTCDEKDAVIKNYLEKCSHIPCKHYERKGSCPLGRICFYKHVKNGRVVDKSTEPGPRVRKKYSSSRFDEEIVNILYAMSLNGELDLSDFLDSDSEYDSDSDEDEDSEYYSDSDDSVLYYQGWY